MPPAADVQGSDPAKNDSDVSTPGQPPRAPSPSTVPRSGTQTIASLSLDVSEEQSDLPPSPSSIGEKSDIKKNDLEKGKGDTESDHPPAPSTALQPAEQPVPALRLEGGFARSHAYTLHGTCDMFEERACACCALRAQKLGRLPRNFRTNRARPR